MKLIRITTVPQSLRGLLKGQLKFMKSQGFEVIGVSSSGEALDDVHINEGVQTVAINMTRTISPLSDLKSLIQLIKFFKKEKPEIVHTHTPKAGLLGMLAAKIVGVPYRLHTVAGMPLTVATGFKRLLLNKVEVLTYACATKVYPNSYGLNEIILENKFTRVSKLKVLGSGSSNGIDTSFFDPELISQDSRTELKKKLGIKTDEFVFIFVGRLVKDKGINELVSAFIKLDKESLIKPKLLLVGPLENELDALQEETLCLINNHSNIISVGYQKDVRPYFAISDVLVFPSYREGFPNVVMQAGAMGIPSIVSNINGCNEIIVENVNGMIIPVRNIEAIFYSMKKIGLDSCYSNFLRENCRRMIEERYEQKHVWKIILNEYNSLSNKVKLK
ncbi:glycosyltransferase family 4 protein [Myroides odoratus]|uniref:glycosyltransferase family 4 protein n=1 Tax=Myroides odoratus TaxID=256 RepID=UPI0039AFDD73